MATKKTEPKAGTKKLFYIVVWDYEDGDPVAVFDTEKEAKEFIEKALTEESVETPDGNDYELNADERASMRLYKGTLIGQPKVTITFE